MKNIFFNLQVFQFKNFLNCPRHSVNLTSVKLFSSSLVGYQYFNERNERSKSVRQNYFRYLSTSVKKFEKVTKISSSAGKNNDISLVYSGSLTYKIKGVKVFTCMTSIGGIIIQPWMLQNILNKTDVTLGVALLSCVGFFTFVTPFLCHLVTKKYVTEIWYNSITKTYTATVLSFFLRRINIDFKVEDITVPSVPLLFTTMYIKGRPVFIISDSFLEIEHYKKMMGYDKPMDLNQNLNTLNKPQSEEKSKIM